MHDTESKHTFDTPLERVLRAGIGLLVFVAVLAMSPQTREASEPIKALAVQWGAFVLFLTLSLGCLNERRSFTQPGPLLLLFAAFVALNVASAAWSDYPRYSFDQSRRLIALLGLSFVAAQVYRRPQHLRPLLASFTIAVAISSLYAFTQKFGFDPFPWADRTGDIYRGLPGTLGNPNLAGHVMVIAVLAAAALAFESRWRWAALTLPVFAAHFYFTGHRAGVLAIFIGAGAALVAIAIGRSKTTAPQKALALAGSAIAIAVTLLGAVLLVAATNRKEATPADISTLVRLNGYYNTAQMIADRPLRGYGPGAYIIESPRYWTPFERDWFETERVMNRRVHNEYLENAVESGLVGSGLYIAIFVVAIATSAALFYSVASTPTRRTGLLFVALFSAFAVDGAFGFNFNSPASGALVALSLGALAGLASQTRAPRSIRANIAILLASTFALLLCASALAELRRYQSEVQLHRGRSLLDADRFDEAERAFTRAEALTPWNWSYPRFRGVARYETGDYAGAIPHLQRSLDLNPNWMPTLIPLANAALNQAGTAEAMTLDERKRHLNDAVQYAQQALKLNDRSALAAEALGRARYTEAALAARNPEGATDLTEHWTLARDALQWAIDNGPEEPGVLLAMLGQAHSTLGDAEKAFECLAEAVRVQPDQDTHWTTLLNHAQKYERFDAFQNLSAEILHRSNEQNPRVLLWHAIGLDMGGAEPDTTIAAYREALKARTDEPQIWGQFGYYVAKQRRPQAFRETVQAMSDPQQTPAPPDIAGLRALSAIWLQTPPDYTAAIAALEDHIAAQPPPQRDREAREIRWAAMLLAQQLDAPQNPEQAHVLARVAQFLLDTGEFEHAQQSFERAASAIAGEQQGVYLAQAADAAIRQGNANEAAALADRAMLIAPENDTALWVHARVLADRDAHAEAAEVARKLLRSPRLPSEMRAEIEALLERIAPQ